MPQKSSHRRSATGPVATVTPSAEPTSRPEPKKPHRDRPSQAWDDLRQSKADLDHTSSELTKLIEQDAPLRHHSGLVLMYGPFQAELAPEQKQGVATWMRDCVRKHGVPSLVRYDHRRRAQVFRRDQFQLWLEPLLAMTSS